MVRELYSSLKILQFFRIKILKILQFLLLPSEMVRELFESLELKFLLLPSPLMGENSFELKIFLNFNSEESLLLQRQKWWLENSIRVFRIKIQKNFTLPSPMVVFCFYKSKNTIWTKFLMVPSMMVDSTIIPFPMVTMVTEFLSKRRIHSNWLEFFRFCFYKSKNTSPFVPFPSYLGTKGDKREQRQSSLTITFAFAKAKILQN
jgi:hypothetical protein